MGGRPRRSTSRRSSRTSSGTYPPAVQSAQRIPRKLPIPVYMNADPGRHLTLIRDPTEMRSGSGGIRRLSVPARSPFADGPAGSLGDGDRTLAELRYL